MGKKVSSLRWDARWFVWQVREIWLLGSMVVRLLGVVVTIASLAVAALHGFAIWLVIAGAAVAAVVRIIVTTLQKKASRVNRQFTREAPTAVFWRRRGSGYP